MGKPPLFHGEQAKWRDFAVVFAAHCAATDAALNGLMQEYVDAEAAPSLRNPTETDVA